MTGVHIYNTAVSRRQYTKQANQSTCERTSQGVAIHALSTLGSLPANGLSVYLQSELSLLSTAAGPSARWVSADLDKSMISTNSRRSYVRTPRVVRVVNSRLKGVDQKNRKKALRFSSVVNWSSRIYRMAKVEQKESEASPLTDSRAIENSSCPVDHPSSDSTAVQRFPVVKSKPGRVDHPDHFSGEVTQ